MTEDKFIAAIFDREGRTYAEPPQIDQPTACGGITAPMLSAWLKRPVTVEDLKALTVPQATDILRWNIRNELTSHGFDKIPYEPLRWQMLDFAWNSGPSTAIKFLQRTIGVVADGIIGPATLARFAGSPIWTLPVINNALAGERAHMAYHGTITQKFQGGIARRAIEFVLPLDEPVPAVAS